MSRFYASIQGGRGEATRQGTAKAGISGHIRGWNIGLKIRCFVDSEGKDVCQVYKTAGSRGAGCEKLLATVKEGEKEA